MTPQTGTSGRNFAGLTSSLDRIDELGIVGAGGGGFPTAVKYTVPVFIGWISSTTGISDGWSVSGSVGWSGSIASRLLQTDLLNTC